jgi:hypothetical protein
VRSLDLFTFVLAIYDVASDLIFLAYLAANEELHTHFIFALAFFGISLIYNAIVMIVLVFQETRSDEFNKWMARNKRFIFICVVAATNIGVLDIITSNIWGLALFSAGQHVTQDGPWSPQPDSPGRLRLLGLSSIGTLIEGIPSLAISISATYVMNRWSIPTTLSVTASVVGLACGIAKGVMGSCILVRRHGCNCLCIKTAPHTFTPTSKTPTSNTELGTGRGIGVTSPFEETPSHSHIITPNLSTKPTNANTPPNEHMINEDFELITIPHTPDPSIAPTPPFTPTALHAH